MASLDIVELLLHLLREGLWIALLVSVPAVAAAWLAGFVVSVLQAGTQIGEPTLTFAPKVVAVALALGLTGPWIARHVRGFTIALYELLPQLAQG